MYNFKLKILSIITILFILFPLVMPITTSLAASELVTIYFEDEVLYNKIVENLGAKITSKDSENLTIYITQDRIDGVTSLNLSGSSSSTSDKITKLNGIEEFTNLTSLTLDYNTISDITPLAKLTNLEELYLNNNNISDISSLSKLTNLIDLELMYNNISSISSLSGLTKLTELCLSGNNISSISSLSKLTNLTLLYVLNNNITDISALSNLTKLTRLSLSSNNITNISALSNLTNVFYLIMSNNKISDISPLANLTSLTTLQIGQNNITDISALSNLTKLKSLYLAENQITDISALANLTQLTSLTLANNEITDIKVLSNLTNLQELIINSNNITDISPLTKLTKLKTIRLRDNQISDVNILDNELKSVSTPDAETGIAQSQNVHTYYRAISTSQAVDLPDIFLRAKNDSSRFYTTQDFTLENCTLINNETRVYITDTSSVAKVTINGGEAANTVLTLEKDDVPPVLARSYSTTKPTNQDVTVTIATSEEVQEVPGWDMSEDCKTLTRDYPFNTTETVTVYDLVGNPSTISIEINNIDITPPIADVTYSTTSDTNQPVVATITANEELQELEGWTISEDKKSLTKTYTSNNDGEYLIIKDLVGNETYVMVDVNNIDITKPTATVSYSTTNLTNQNVTVTIDSYEELQSLSGWTLSSDKMTLTKSYSSNTTETVTIKDLVGNETTVNISITNIDKEKPTLGIQYSTKDPTNQNVTVTIVAYESIQQVSGWTLSSDKKTLTKTYTANGTETITVTDLAGNTNSITVNVDNIDKTAIVATVSYSTTLITNQNVTATITTNKAVKSVSGWTSSSDNKTLTKSFTQNNSEELTLTDNAGNTKAVTISVSNIDKVKPEIEVKYSTTEITNQDVEVIISANETLQQLDGWTLSSDGKSLTKTYNLNGGEEVTVKDLAGNENSAVIEVKNIDKVSPELEVKYSTTISTYNDVIVTVTANESLQGIEGWTLSEDGKTLSKTYSENGQEDITVKDLAGNEAPTSIEVSNIDKNAPELEVKYSTTKTTSGDVIVKITSNEAIQPNEGWTISDDMKSLTKTYSANQTEDITIKDMAGNSSTIAVKVANIKNTSSSTGTSNSNNGSNNNSNSNENRPSMLPDTGGKIIISVFIITLLIGGICYLRYRKLKDIK